MEAFIIAREQGSVSAGRAFRGLGARPSFFEGLCVGAFLNALVLGTHFAGFLSVTLELQPLALLWLRLRGKKGRRDQLDEQQDEGLAGAVRVRKHLPLHRRAWAEPFFWVCLQWLGSSWAWGRRSPAPDDVAKSCLGRGGDQERTSKAQVRAAKQDVDQRNGN